MNPLSHTRRRNASPVFTRISKIALSVTILLFSIYAGWTVSVYHSIKLKSDILGPGPVHYHYVWDTHAGGYTHCDTPFEPPLDGAGSYLWSIRGIEAEHYVDSYPVGIFYEPTLCWAILFGQSVNACDPPGWSLINALGIDGDFSFIDNDGNAGGTSQDPDEFYWGEAYGRGQIQDCGGPPMSCFGTTESCLDIISGTLSGAGWEVNYQVPNDACFYFSSSNCSQGCNETVWGWSGYYAVEVHLDPGVVLPASVDPPTPGFPGVIPPKPDYPAVAELGPKGILPPYVSIFCPTNVTVFPTAPATVVIAINAADPDGSVQSVEVYNDTEFIGMAYQTVNAYSFNGYLYTFFWEDVQPGTYTLTTKATDNENAETTSGPVTIIVRGRPIEPVQPLQPIAGGFYHSLAAKYDGTVWAWGANNAGQLGDGSTTSQEIPIQTDILPSVSSVAGGVLHSMALTFDGKVWAWGHNSKGQLGDGTTTTKPTPFQVGGLPDAVGISAGHWFSSYAVGVDGSAWAWGYNIYGQLGDGTTTLRTTPTQLTTLSGVVAIEGGQYHALALLSDGTVRAWGKNSFGSLGNGTTIQSSLPVQVMVLPQGGPPVPFTDVVQISTGLSSSYALRSDGSVWAWGYNGSGQLGIGSAVTQSVLAYQVSTLSDGVIAISGGGDYCFALKEDGSLWGWGKNTEGQLGDGTAITRYTPVPITGQALTVAAGTRKHALSVDVDGTLRSWGANIKGELGDGTTTSRSSPGPLWNNFGLW